MDSIVIDVEIQKEIKDLPGGWDDTHQMGISTCVIWEDLTERFTVYGPGEDERIRDRILRADRVSGFNIVGFDYAVIWGVERPAWANHPDRRKVLSKTNDILRRIWVAMRLNPDQFNPRTHGGYKLDDVIRDTGVGPGKIAEGAQAPVWFKEGKHARLIEYCIDDVRLERDLTRFVDRYGYVIRKGMQIKLDGTEGR